MAIATPPCPPSEQKLEVLASFSCIEMLLKRPPSHMNVTSVVLLAWVTGAAALDVTRFLSYHLLLGVTSAVVMDNWCGSTAATVSLDAALAPFAARVLHLRKFRCVPWSGKLQMSGYDTAMEEHRKWANTQHLRVSEHTLMLRLDVDEYLVLKPHGQTLLAVREAMSAHRICALFLSWRVFGSSGHRCRPPQGLLPSYTRRARTDIEAVSDSFRREANLDAQRHGLAALYGHRSALNSGKILYLDGTTNHVGLHSNLGCRRPTEMIHCGNPRHLPSHDACWVMATDHPRSRPRRNKSSAPPVPSPFQLQLNHYNFQSAAQWETKKRVPLCNGPNRAVDCNVALLRRGPVPVRFEEVKDSEAIELTRQRVDHLGGELGGCLRQLLLP